METLDRFKEIIEKRAKDKAYKEVSELQRVINQSGLLELDEKFFVINGDTFNENLRSSFWTIGELRLDKEKDINPLNSLYKSKYKEYVKSETDNFISQIETLTSQTNNLLQLSDNIQKEEFDDLPY